MKKLLLFMFVFQSCTYSVNMVLTNGKAQDVVDEVQSPTNDTNPEVSFKSAAM